MSSLFRWWRRAGDARAGGLRSSRLSCPRCHNGVVSSGDGCAVRCQRPYWSLRRLHQSGHWHQPRGVGGGGWEVVGNLGLLPCEVGVSPKVSGYQEPWIWSLVLMVFLGQGGSPSSLWWRLIQRVGWGHQPCFGPLFVVHLGCSTLERRHCPCVTS